MLAGPWIGILPCRHAVILMYTLPIGRIIPRDQLMAAHEVLAV